MRVVGVSRWSSMKTIPKREPAQMTSCHGQSTCLLGAGRYGRQPLGGFVPIGKWPVPIANVVTFPRRKPKEMDSCVTRFASRSMKQTVSLVRESEANILNRKSP